MREEEEEKKKRRREEERREAKIKGMETNLELWISFMEFKSLYEFP